MRFLGVTISFSAEVRRGGSSRENSRCEGPKAERGAQAHLTQQRNKGAGAGGAAESPGFFPRSALWPESPPPNNLLHVG